MTTRLAVIGCGAIGRAVHGPAQRRCADEMPDLALAACCDLDGDRAEAYRETFGFERTFTDLDHMFREVRPTAAVLLSPPEATCKLTCHLASYGIPLLIEKPPGLTTDELDRMIAATRDVPVMVAFNRRFTPLIAAMRKRVDVMRHAGKLRAITCEFLRHNRRDPDFSTTAIHGIDAALCVLGQRLFVAHLEYTPIPEAGPTVAAVDITGTTQSGIMIHVTINPMVGQSIERYIAHASDENIMVELPMFTEDDHVGQLIHVQRDKVIHHESSGGDRIMAAGFYQETRAFCEAVKSRGPFAPTLNDCRQSVALMQAMRQRQRKWRAD